MRPPQEAKASGLKLSFRFDALFTSTRRVRLGVAGGPHSFFVSGYFGGEGLPIHTIEAQRACVL